MTQSESRSLPEGIEEELLRFLQVVYDIPGFTPHPHTVEQMKEAAARIASLSEIASPDALYTALVRKVTASQWQNEHYNQGLWDMKEALKGKEK